MSIAQQVATPTPSSKARRSPAPQSARARGTIRTLLGIAALVAVTALGAFLTMGAVAVAVVLIVSSLGA